MSGFQQLFKSARNRPVVNMQTGEYRFLRYSMWVAVQRPGEPKQVGIISKPLEAVLFNDSTVVVDIVDANGVTVQHDVQVPAMLVRQAWLEEIPRARLPDKRVAAALGYQREGSR